MQILNHLSDLGSNLQAPKKESLSLSMSIGINSDKWLRICMFQGAPLPDELKKFNDNWIYNSLN